MGDLQVKAPEESDAPSVNNETTPMCDNDVLEQVDSDEADAEPHAEPDSTESVLDDSSTLESLTKPYPTNTEHISKINPHNPAFLKPLESGWKREMVLRNPTGDNKRRVDVYYYTPSGKKLRSLKSVAEHLEGTELTLDNFTFTRSSVGIDDPEKEIVRNAKRSLSDDSSGFSKKKKKMSRRDSSDLSGTPRVVFRSGVPMANSSGPLGGDDLDEETCSWLPPMWGKLLSILNRQY